jgi:NAD(P)H-flavin reductase
MKYEYHDAIVINIIDESDLVKRFFIQMPSGIGFSFRAGQFVMLDLPIHARYTNRSYSIASAPSDDNIIELCMVLKPTGLGTRYAWEHFRIGTVVKVSNALGKFLIKEPIDTDICFIATGTGIAPLRSQLLDTYNRKIPHKNIYLVFGNRYEKDILYRNEFEKLAVQFSEFTFIPVLSRENPGWTGRKGYVHAVYEEIFSDLRPAMFYICGWSEMLKEARLRLASMGYDRKSVKFESYD